jgi:hypothetical protein
MGGRAARSVAVEGITTMVHSGVEFRSRGWCPVEYAE